jgi:hypothetical protein
MPAPHRGYLLETCMLCDRLAPDRFALVRSPDRFGNERAPMQRRMAPVCARCLDLLRRAGPRGLVEVESGARWTLAAALEGHAAPPPAVRLPAAPPA